MSECLDEEAVLGLVEGRLAAGALDAAEGHLDDCTSCRDVVAQLSRINAPTKRELVRGQQLGRYVVGELLGAGAMGRVYSAWQPELDRQVAIKVLHDDGATDRLIREARAMARLNHANVVGVHEVTTLDDGGVYVVMDLVEGDTLRAWAETRREWREVVRVVIEIARGLAAVHAAGVIHRDIKPDNIIVGTDGRARLGDFGLARGAGTKVRPGRLVDSVSFDDTVIATPERAVAVHSPIAASGTAIAGTPVYMALELLQGRVATPASDQFALGVTAYELLTGTRPFTGTTWAELAKSVERPPAPLRDVPGWLATAIRRCLAVEPAKRFPSLSAVADHLGERVQRRRPLWIAGAAAAVIASSVTFALTRGDEAPVAGSSCNAGELEIVRVWSPAARAQLSVLGAPTLSVIDQWTARWATEHDATCTASRTAPIAKTTARERCLLRQRDDLAALLDRSRQLGTSSDLKLGQRSINNSDPARFDGVGTGGGIGDRLVDTLAMMPPADCSTAEPGTADPVPVVAANEIQTVERELPKARAAIALGDARPIIELTAKLVEQARAHAPTLAEALHVRAEALAAIGELANAAIAARDALAAAERGHDDQTAARVWVTRVWLAVDRRDLIAADDLAPIASAAIDRAGPGKRLHARLLRLRALIAYNRGNYAESTRLLDEARASFVTLAGETSIEVAGVESSLGSTARAAGDLDAAERHHRGALALDRELRGPKHPDVARDLHNLAGVLRLRGRLAAAEKTYLDSLAISDELARIVEGGLTHNSLGLVRLARKDLPGARAEFARALAALTAAGHGDRAFAKHNLGLVAAALGDHRKAVEEYEAAAAIYAQTVGADAAPTIRLDLDRARSLAALGDRATARAAATRARDAAKRRDLPWIVDQARELLGQGRPARPAIEVSVEPVAGARQPITQPSKATEPPSVAPPPVPKPQPEVKPDVGVYGASQGG